MGKHPKIQPKRHLGIRGQGARGHEVPFDLHVELRKLAALPRENPEPFVMSREEREAARKRLSALLDFLR